MFSKKSIFRILSVLLVVLIVVSGAASARPLGSALGTGFTYQGKLADGGLPANGSYDLQFKLYDALSGGTQVGSTITKEDVTVTTGLFAVQLDFGNVFNGTALYLEIGVRPGTSLGAYAPLVPLQPLSPAPYAIYASNAPWSGLSGVPAGFADGVDDNTTYTAGYGLDLTGTQFSVATGTVQARVSGTCAIGSTIRLINADGTVVCQVDDNTTYTAGYGLNLTGTQFSVATGTVQARVSGTCAIGSTIQSINADGTVVCQPEVPLNRSNAPAANTISTVTNTGDISRQSSMTIGTDGLGLIARSTTSTIDMYVDHCNDLACTSTTTTHFSDAGENVGGPSIVIGADGLGLIAYRRSNDFGAVEVLHCDNINCSSATVSIPDNYNASNDLSLTIGGDGLGLISFRNGFSSNLMVAHCNNLACTAAAVNSVDSSGYFTSITTGVDGLGLISYRRNDTGDLKVAHCSNAVCSAYTLTTLDSVNDTGNYTSLVIGADGRGLISYYDLTTGNLRVAHCNDVICSSATLSTVENVSMNGAYTSITLGADGLGLISYYDATLGVLKIAHCTDLACTSATINPLDSVPGMIAASNMGLTVGVDGLGLVGYYDAASANLKVAHCANLFCSPYFRRR